MGEFAISELLRVLKSKVVRINEAFKKNIWKPKILLMMTTKNKMSDVRMALEPNGYRKETK